MPVRNIIIGQRVEEAKILRAKELRRDMPPEEKTLWQHVRRNQLGGLHFRRQQPIDGFIVDFYCHAAGVVVEVDGPIHEGLAESDRARDAVLASRGLTILRVTNEQVRGQLSEVLDRILQCCEGGLSNSPNPPAPFPKREGGEREKTPNPPAPFPKREGGENCSPPRFGEGLGEGLF